MLIRDAARADVPALNAIYNRYIVGSHVSFDTEPWSDDQRLAWFEDRIDNGYVVLVAVVDGSIVGASWSGSWRDKAAYRTTAETTVVLDETSWGHGVGTALYGELLDRLSLAGFHVAIGVVALPNEASIALHRKLGYREVGVLEEVGSKDGRYHSTMLLEKRLGPR